MGHPEGVIYDEKDALWFAATIQHAIFDKDFSENEGNFNANELAWRLRWIIEKWGLKEGYKKREKPLFEDED